MTVCIEFSGIRNSFHGTFYGGTVEVRPSLYVSRSGILRGLKDVVIEWNDRRSILDQLHWPSPISFRSHQEVTIFVKYDGTEIVMVKTLLQIECMSCKF